MRERCKHWQQKIKSNKWWLVGAIATPAFIWIVWWLWLLPDHKLQSDYSRPSPNEKVTLAHQHREIFISGIGAIATIAGGIFLVRNFRIANKDTETVDLCDANLSGVDFNGADLVSANFNGADLSGANLSGADLRYANLISANLSGADLSGAELRYTNLSGADLRYTNLSRANLRYANLSGANLNCAFLSGANLSDANLSGALLFFINLRDVLNLEPFQLEAKPSPFLCNVALPYYSSQPDVNPNRACNRIPQLLSDRYDISLEEAQGIVDEARQHQWN